MAQSTFNGDLFVNGSLSSTTFTAPASSITDTMIAANAKIKATKLIHQHAVTFNTDPNSSVIADTQIIHIAHALGEVAFVEVMATTAPTSSDQVTVDILKGNAGASYSSVLSSVVTLTSSDADRAVVSGTITTTDYAAADSFQIVIVPTGTSTKGLCVVVTLHENAQ